MTVRELLRELGRLSPEASVWIETDRDADVRKPLTAVWCWRGNEYVVLGEEV